MQFFAYALQYPMNVIIHFASLFYLTCLATYMFSKTVIRELKT